MFNLFSKKDKAIPVTDIVWPSQTAKWNGLIDCWKKDNSVVIACWFDATFQHLQSLPGWGPTSSSLKKADNTWPSHLNNKKVIFAEHYPIKNREQDIFRQWLLSEAIVYSSLEEPLFQQFGGEKILQLMKSMGMKENESFQHNLISSSITKAQEKIEKKADSDISSHSQEEWFQKNFPLNKL